MLTALSWRHLLDKNQTQELILSLKLILIGIFFWIIQVKYFTFFWLHKFHFLNVFDLEIIGTILILIGILIIHRVYPFAYSFIAIFLNCFILIINILDFFLFGFKIFRQFQQYSPFIMSLMLILISKLMESGIRYFGNAELSKKWRYIGIIIFFGFSIPFYTYVSLNVCGFIEYDKFFHFRPKVLLLFLPLIFTLLFLLIYY